MFSIMYHSSNLLAMSLSNNYAILGVYIPSKIIINHQNKNYCGQAKWMVVVLQQSPLIRKSIATCSRLLLVP